MAMVLSSYLVALGVNVTSTPESTDYRPLAAWLADHGLRYGLSTYELASSVTLASGNRVQVRPVATSATSGDGKQLYPRMWEADRPWYNPSLHYANFVIQGQPGGATRGLTSAPSALPSLKSLLYTFGRPVRRYRVDGVTVLVWDYNLLTRTAWGHNWPVFDPSIPLSRDPAFRDIKPPAGVDGTSGTRAPTA
jgi:hypothetical protein